MSFFESITKKSKLKAAIKKTTEARSSEGGKSDQLFRMVYQDYAEVVANEPVVAEALYNWGFALLHQARNKSGEQATKLYQDAVAKFSFCLTIEPAYLGAAIDGGVAYMELARVQAVGSNDSLYGRAKNYFEKANAIQAGSASYNLACIYGLRGEKEACLTALEIAKGKGSLPATADILGDPDLGTVKNQHWFVAFMETLDQEPEAVVEIVEAVASNEKAEVADDAATDADEDDAVVAEEPINEKAQVEDDVAAVAEFEAIVEHKAEVDEAGTANEKTEVTVEAESSKVDIMG